MTNELIAACDDLIERAKNTFFSDLKVYRAFVEAVSQAKSKPDTVQIKRMTEAEALNIFGRSRYGRSLMTDSMAGRDIIAAAYAFGLIASDPYRDFLAAHPNLNDTPDTKAAFNAMQEDGK